MQTKVEKLVFVCSWMLFGYAIAMHARKAVGQLAKRYKNAIDMCRVVSCIDKKNKQGCKMLCMQMPLL